MMTADAAVAIWRGRRHSHLIRLARTITETTQVDDLVRDIVLDLVREHYRPALAWLAAKIIDAGHSLDAVLTWERIKNEKLRDWFEDHDNIGAGIIQAINALAGAIAEDCESVRGRTADDVAAESCLALLGSDSAVTERRWFDRTSPRDTVRLPAIRRDRAEAEALMAQIEQLASDLAEAQRRADEAEAALTAMSQIDQIETIDEVEADTRARVTALEAPAVLSDELTDVPSPRARLESAMAADAAERRSPANAPQTNGRRRRHRSRR
jgi:hypothetical protein